MCIIHVDTHLVDLFQFKTIRNCCIKTDLQPGDLLIFDNNRDGTADHVGIYTGGGYFVHAENSRTGVKTDTVSRGHYNNCYYSARRIVK